MDCSWLREGHLTLGYLPKAAMETIFDQCWATCGSATLLNHRTALGLRHLPILRAKITAEFAIDTPKVDFC